MLKEGLAAEIPEAGAAASLGTPTWIGVSRLSTWTGEGPVAEIPEGSRGGSEGDGSVVVSRPQPQWIEEGPLAEIPEGSRYRSGSDGSVVVSRPQPQRKKEREKDECRGVVLEICGGCCRLTRALEELHFEALGIDWRVNQAVPEGKAIIVDLTSKGGHGTGVEAPHSQKDRFCLDGAALRHCLAGQRDSDWSQIPTRTAQMRRRQSPRRDCQRPLRLLLGRSFLLPRRLA
jgi:hypothetical protein